MNLQVFSSSLKNNEIKILGGTIALILFTFASGYLTGNFEMALILAIFLLVLAVLACFFFDHPELSIYIMVFTLPIMIGTRSTVTLSKVIGTAVIMLFIGELLVKRKLIIPGFSALPYYLLFVFSIIISTIAFLPPTTESLRLASGLVKFSPGITAGIMEVIRAVHALFLVFAIMYYINTKKRFDICVNAIILSTIVPLAYGFLQYTGFIFGFYQSIKLRHTIAGIIPRMVSTLIEPQGFANYFFMAIIITLAKYMSSRKQSYPLLLLIFLQVLAIILTFSTGGYAAFGTALIVFLYLSRGLLNSDRLKELKILAVGLPVPVILIGLYMKFDVLLLGFDRIYRMMQFQNPHRIGSIQAGWNMFLSNPLFGVGPGNFGYHYNYFKPPEAMVLDYPDTVQSQYLKVLAEQGLFGAIAFLLLVFFIFKPLLASIKNVDNKEYRIYAAAFVAVLSGFLVQYVAMPGFFFPYLWPVVALSQVCIILAKNNEDF